MKKHFEEYVLDELWGDGWRMPIVSLRVEATTAFFTNLNSPEAFCLVITPDGMKVGGTSEEHRTTVERLFLRWNSASITTAL